ncbi:hypothetical protein FE257_005561 [Aspergillus nanangensis]|uniref:Uncharacterized protein n=1 Tax=Aspergillus nanangensis TaxID=2582783 RepID=A0AAD4GVI3_ASPNN|nr:hypothetical protein FE257_005561 [Aspergillus nanangensis]
MARSSNEKRALRRQECREALSEHIYNRLRLRIDPDEVRLQPAPQDVGLYEEIYLELGVSLEAVRPAILKGDWEAPDTDKSAEPQPSPLPHDDSFTATIQRLDRENHQLYNKLDHLHVSMKTCQHRSQILQTRNRHLQEEIRRQRDHIYKLEKDITGMKSSICEAVVVLERTSKK